MLSDRLRINSSRGAWLTLLFLALGVVAPTVCILWFMNEAATAQAETARQSVAEAYRGQLRFLGERLDWYWKGRLTSINQSAADGQAPDFARAVKAGLADSLVLPHYPALTETASAGPA